MMSVILLQDIGMKDVSEKRIKLELFNPKK
jgi:hypothetical protein